MFEYSQGRTPNQLSRMLRLMMNHLRRIAGSEKKRTQALRNSRREVKKAVCGMIDMLPPLPIGDKGRNDAEDDDGDGDSPDDDGDGDVRAERGDGEQGAEHVEEMNGGAVRSRERELKRKISGDDTGFPKMIGDQEMEQPQRKLMKQVSVDSGGYPEMLGSHSPPRTTTVARTIFRPGSLFASRQEEFHKQAMAAKEVPSPARAQRKLVNENAPLTKGKGGDRMESASLGKLYKTQAKDSTYFCAQRPDQPKKVLIVSVTAKMTQDHRGMCDRLMKEVCEKDLTKEQALRRRDELLEV